MGWWVGGLVGWWAGGVWTKKSPAGAGLVGGWVDYQKMMSPAKMIIPVQYAMASISQ